MKAPYQDIKKIFHSIDKRKKKYLFSLEHDIPWDKTDAHGLHFGPSFLRSVGIDPTLLQQYPHAFNAFQWGVGLELSRSFSVLERYLLNFVDDEGQELENTTSIQSLYEEEIKHIALFDRYARHLEERQPQWVSSFDLAFEPYKPALMNPYNREAYTDKTLQHYFFWLKTLFFEEYTIYLHERLLENESDIQPVWLAAHACHRQEEQHHIITDAAYLRALNIDEGLKKACSKSFWTHMEETFNLFLGISATRDFVRALYPHAAHVIPNIPTHDMPIYRDILYHPRFKKTRAAAPFRHPLPAIVKGPTLSTLPTKTIVEALDQTIQEHPQKGIHYHAPNGNVTFHRYDELKKSALNILGNIPPLPPRTPILIFANEPQSFIPLFWACLFGNYIPVPIGGKWTLKQLQRKLLALEKKAFIIAPKEHEQNIQSICINTITMEPLFSLSSAQCTPHKPKPEDVAFIQFSSGSTSVPKGIQLTHRSLLSNSHSIIMHQHGGSNDRFLSWLPLYHDMGLIGYHILPIIFGAQQVHLTPFMFLKDPMIWLELLSHYRSTVTASPNFGLQYCLLRFNPQRAQNLDLSSIHCLLNGAEPISYEHTQLFCSALQHYGFSDRAMTPAYGLAEGTLCITAKPKNTRIKRIRFCRKNLSIGATVLESEEGAEFVACGQPIHGIQIRITGSNSQPLKEGQVGQIEISGINLFDGYTPALPKQRSHFTAGDLGVWYQGDLYIIGRTKEFFIQNGCNIYAVDIEKTLEEKHNITAAIAYAHPENHNFLCVAVVPHKKSKKEEIEHSVRNILAATFSIEQVHIRWISTRDIPRTSSGKRQRYKLTKTHTTALITQGKETPKDSTPHATHSLEQLVRRAWAKALKYPLNQLRNTVPFSEYGGSSIAATHVHVLLEDDLKQTIPYELITTCNTIAEMVYFLSKDDALLTEPSPTLSNTEQTIRAQDIAIIGMGVRLANVDTIHQLWSVLQKTTDTYTDVPAERWNHVEFSQSIPNTTLCPKGSFIDSPFDFDPNSFGISQTEAQHLNPQYRLLLETATQAMEDAGLSKGNVGVFASQGEAPTNFRSFLDNIEKGNPAIDGLLANSTNNMLSSLISRHFNLTGPSLVIQGACASSLVATHQACLALQNNECDTALVGAVELLHTPTLYALFSQAGVLSPSGACRPFTENADGFVPGEGSLAIVLKPLEKAIQHGDRIYATIKGSAIGNDGAVFSNMAPNPSGQKNVIRRALKQAQLSPRDIEYIETHGTGTPVGDSVEIQALSSFYQSNQKLGAIKSTFGHILAGAGLLSVVASALSIYKKQIPPVSNWGRCNPRLPAHSFCIPKRLESWTHTPRRMAINALGIGGTNAHMILESYTQSDPPIHNTHIACLGARTTKGLQRRARQIHTWLQENPTAPLSALSATMFRAAMPHRYRCTTTIHNIEECRAWLHTVETTPYKQKKQSMLALVFPGPGSQTHHMGKDLLSDPIYSSIIQKVVDICAHHNIDLTPYIYGKARKTEDIRTLQLLVFATSVASAQWLKHMGVRIDSVIGHSGGEYAAMVVSGVLSLSSACQALLARAKAMVNSPRGRMLAVFSDAQTIASLLPHINIAAYNAPQQITISGTPTEIADAEETLQNAHISFRNLAIPCAAHSPLMNEPAQAFASEIQSAHTLEFHPPKTPFFSSKTGCAETALSRSYLVEQLREPVRFHQAVHAAIESGIECFMEVGGAAILSPVIQSISPSVTTMGMRRSSVTEFDSTLSALGHLFDMGHPIRLGRLYRGTVDLPPYPFQKQSYPIALAMEQHQTQHPFSAPAAALQEKHHQLTDEDLHLFSQHRVYRKGMAPAAWMINKIFAHSPKTNTSLSKIIVERPLAPAGRSWPWRITSTKDNTISLQTKNTDWHTHLRAEKSTHTVSWPIIPPSIRAEELPPQMIYKQLQRRGMLYGPDFQTIQRIQKLDQQLWIELESSLPHDDAVIDPTILDGVFQAMAAYSLSMNDVDAFLGFSIGQLHMQGRICGPSTAHIQLQHPLTKDMDVIRCDIVVQARNGGTLFLKDFSAKRIVAQKPSLLHHIEWIPFSPQLKMQAGNVCVLHRGHPKRAFALCNQLWNKNMHAYGPISLEDIHSPAGIMSMQHSDVVIVLDPTIEDGWNLAQIRKCASHKPAIISIGSPHSAALFRSYAAEGNTVCSIIEDEPIDERTLASLFTCTNLPSSMRYHNNRWEISALTPLINEKLADVSFSDKVYWILGGSGGIGQALCLHIEKNGGIAIATSRSTPAQKGLAGDITNKPELISIRDHIIQAHGKIDGIIHCAGTLQNKRLEECTKEDIDTYTDSKIIGGAHLCQLASSLQLERLIFISSLTSLVPSPNQTLYAASNAYLDQLAQTHHHIADQTISINFGPWSESGMVRNSPYKTNWTRKGLHPLTTKQGIEAFSHALRQTNRHIVAGNISGAHRNIGSVPGSKIQLFPSQQSKSLSEDNIDAQPVSYELEQTKTFTEHTAKDLSQWLYKQLAQSLRCTVPSIDGDASFSELGVDSLMAVELVQKIELQYDCVLHPTLLFEFPTPNTLMQHLKPLLKLAAPLKPTISHTPNTDIAPDEVRIMVKSWGLNFIDVLGKHGIHPTQQRAQHAPGHEVSGTIIEVGSSICHVREGDDVMALAQYGAFTNELITKGYLTQTIPSNIHLVDGAGIFINGLTAISCVEIAGQVQKGDRVLIHSAAGGTGLACTQLALSKGAIVYGTIGSEHKREILQKLGVHRIINRTNESFSEVITQECQTVSLIIDGISGDIITQGLRVLEPGGRYVEIAAGTAIQRPKLDPKDLFLRGYSFHGVNLAQIMTNKKQFQERCARLLFHLSNEILTPQIHHRYSYTQLEEAMELLRSGQTIGKVVLTQ